MPRFSHPRTPALFPLTTGPEPDEHLIAHIDGGARGNPGPAGYGVAITDQLGSRIAGLSEYLGHQTNNYAEYSGLLAALQYAIKNGHKALKVISDSELMVKQIKGQYRVNSPELRPLYDEAKRRIARLEQFRIEHVLRGKNQHADRLANEAMDRGTGRASPPASGFRAAVKAVSAPGAPLREAAKAGERPLRGVVKGGMIHLIEGELPEGALVKIMPDSF